MKNIKKISLITLLSAGMIITTACSQTANQTAENKTEQKQEEKKVEVTKNNAFKLVREALDKQKSYKADISILAPLFPQPVKMKLEVKNQPFEHSLLKEDGKVDSFLSTFGKDNFHYIPLANGWKKQERKNNESHYIDEDFKYILNYGKGFTLTEEADTYIVNFNPDIEDYKKFLEYNQLEKITATLKFNKSTLLPISYYKEIIASPREGFPLSKEVLDVTYRDFNSDFTIELPNEVKNSN